MDSIPRTAIVPYGLSTGPFEMAAYYRHCLGAHEKLQISGDNVGFPSERRKGLHIWRATIRSSESRFGRTRRMSSIPAGTGFFWNGLLEDTPDV
jgi:hypothetical protein